MNEPDLSRLSEEFAAAWLQDARLTKRLMEIADAAAMAPADSLPEQMKTARELEATYRFLGNENVSPEAVAQAHVMRTVERAANEGVVLVLHDTTDFAFRGEATRDGLGRGATSQQGFLAHMSLCASLDGQPLGLLALYCWTRSRHTRKGRRAQNVSQFDPDRESQRWSDSVEQSAERLYRKADAIHVQDREGDNYEHFAHFLESGHRFVIRLSHDRRLEPDQRKAAIEVDKLFERLESAPLFLEREVILSRRAKSRTKKDERVFPARDSRRTTLSIRAQRMEIFIGNGAPSYLPRSLTLNFVEVREEAPPEGCEPVIWRLVTSEPIDTLEQVAAVVDTYRQRWLIEEYFKAIKTGCDYESLQLENAHGLLTMLVIDCAVAWRLLLLRWLDRHQPDASAEDLLNSTQLAVLTAVSEERHRPLPANPSVHDVLWAIAALGGHIKYNGPPGWLVLRRGFAKLLNYETGWRAAHTQKDVIKH